MPMTLTFNCFFAGSCQFTVIIRKETGKFEVVEGSALVMSGLVRVPVNVSSEIVSLEPLKPLINDQLLELSSRDIYKQMRLRGYHTKGLFHGLVCADNRGGYDRNSFNVSYNPICHAINLQSSSTTELTNVTLFNAYMCVCVCVCVYIYIAFFDGS
jgi:hypothetical protein